MPGPMSMMTAPDDNQQPSLFSIGGAGSIPPDVGNGVSTQAPPPGPQPGMLAAAMRNPKLAMGAIQAAKNAGALPQTPGVAGVTAPTGFNPTKRGNGQKTEGTATNDQKTTKSSFLQGDDFANITDQLRNMPENQQAQADINDLRQGALSVAGQKPTDQGWINPFLAWVDSSTGSKLGGSYNGGVKQSDINNELLKYQTQIADKQNALSKNLIDGVQKIKDGQSTNDNMTKMFQAFQMGQMGNGANATSPEDKNYQKALQMLAPRGDATYQQAQKDTYAVDKVNRLVSRYQSLNEVNPAAAALLVTDIAKVASGGIPTDGTIKEMLPHTWSGDIASLAEKVKAQPTPANQGALLQSLVGYANGVQQDARNQIQSRNKAIIRPFAQAGLISPEREKYLNESYVDRFGVDDAPPAPGGGASAAAAPAPSGGAPAPAGAHPQDAAAIAWAKNPKSPGWSQAKADAIAKANGVTL